MKNIIGAILITIFLGGYDIARATLNEGLVAHYKFEDNAKDSSGNGYNGTEYKELTYTAGKVGRAAKFDGLRDYVYIPNSAQLNFPNITISAWILIDKDIPVTQVRIVNQQNSPAARSWGLDIFGNTYGGATGNNLTLHGGGNSSTNSNLVSSSNLSTHRWYHVVGTNDGTTMRLYIDGKLNSSKPSLGNNATNINSRIIIGKGPDGDNRFYFPGMIDDLRIYDRALPIEEIKQLAAGDTTPQPPPTPTPGKASLMPVYNVLFGGVRGFNELGVYSGGTGSGTIYSVDSTGNPDGKISCSSANNGVCSTRLNNGTIYLKATANSGSLFVNWGGMCNGLPTNICTVNIQNGSFVVAADFKSTSPVIDARTVDEILEEVSFYEEILVDGIWVLQRISGSNAARKYNWLTNVIATNKSGNLRGMIISAKSHKIHKISNNAGDVMMALSYATELWDSFKNIEDDFDGLDNLADKSTMVAANLAGASARVLAKIPGGTLHTIDNILQYGAWVSPVYWLDYKLNDGRMFENSTFIGDLADTIDVEIDQIYDDGALYNVFVITGDRLAEIIHANGLNPY